MHARVVDKSDQLRPDQLRTLLANLKDDAAHNAQVMSHCAERELGLLTADGLAQLLVRLTAGLRDSFKLHDTRLAIVDPYGVIRELLGGLGVDPSDIDGLQLLDTVDEIPLSQAHAARPVLSPWRREHRWIIEAQVRSVALMPLRRSDGLVGMLCLGSKDISRFSEQLATDFLERLANIAAVCLENAVNRERLRLTGLTDALTGLFNRRYLDQRIREEAARAMRHKEHLACLFIDADHFKRINDEYGHSAGDQVLVEFSRYLKLQLRSSDIATRFGGEEFAVLLPKTDKASACQLAERIRTCIEAHAIPIAGGTQLNITVSVGVGSLPLQGSRTLNMAVQELLDTADNAVYAAKQRGRNCVVHAEEISRLAG